MIRAKKLAEEHWRYVGDLLLTHGEPEHNVNVIGWHYKAAFIHGYKHAMEDATIDKYNEINTIEDVLEEL